MYTKYANIFNIDLFSLLCGMVAFISAHTHTHRDILNLFKSGIENELPLNVYLHVSSKIKYEKLFCCVL